MSVSTFFNTTHVIRNIKVASISRNPNQPRRVFNLAETTALAQSIQQYGVLNPITVRIVDKGFELVAGERRLRAVRMLGLKEIPCIIVRADDGKSSLLALVENMQRSDLDFYEEAIAIKNLMETYKFTQEQIARKVGKTQSAISNKLRLLNLSLDNIKLIRNSNLSERHARCILRLNSEQSRLEATKHIVLNRLNVNQAELYIQQIIDAPKVKPTPKPMIALIKDVRFFINTVDKSLGLMNKSGFDTKIEKKQQENGDMEIFIHISNKPEVVREIEE